MFRRVYCLFYWCQCYVDRRRDWWIVKCYYIFIGNPSPSYEASSALLDHTLLPATTRHIGERAVTVVTTARQAGTRFTSSEGMKGWVDFGVSYIGLPKCYIPVRTQSPIQALTTWSKVEPTTWWSLVQRPNYFTAPNHLYLKKT